MENELEHLRTELGRAYRALAAYMNAADSGEPLSKAAFAYHSLTQAAAKRFVNHGALDGSEYFIGKSVDVLHAALRGKELNDGCEGGGDEILDGRNPNPPECDPRA